MRSVITRVKARADRSGQVNSEREAFDAVLTLQTLARLLTFVFPSANCERLTEEACPARAGGRATIDEHMKLTSVGFLH